MKKFICFLSAAVLTHTHLVSAAEVSGIVAARWIQPDGQTTAFVLVDAAQPAVAVTASGADAVALFPRNQVKLTGTAAESPLGSVIQAKAGSVTLGETNQPFKSQPITAAAFKDASAQAGKYVQLAAVTFVAPKFDATGTAAVKAEDGTVVPLLVGKGVAGLDTPKGVTDVFGVVVKSGAEWKLVATRFLPVNRKEMQSLAATSTCLACHNPDMRAVGPSYREVAASYRNDAGAIEKLVAQMQNGGTGKWGSTPMPGLKATVTDENMHLLAAWILSYKWDTLLAE